MRILILGGTKFVGRALIDEALARGHEVTIFNRGTKPTPSGVTAITGDRLDQEGRGHAVLEGLKFDAVIDTWAGDPAAVSSAVAVLRGNVGFYAYVSSISVYDIGPAGAPPITEDTTLLDADTSEFKYGVDKLRGELAAQSAGVPCLVARAGLIIGPYERVPGRLPWWLNRLHRGGPTLAPGPRELQLQFIDVRDLTTFILDAAEKKAPGVFNIVSHPRHVTMGQFLDAANEVAGGKAELRWTEPDKVLAAGIAPWSELPFWIPPSDKNGSVYSAQVHKAVGAGLRIRPAEETIRDTWAWMHDPAQAALDTDAPHPSIGLDPEKEAAALGRA